MNSPPALKDSTLELDGRIVKAEEALALGLLLEVTTAEDHAEALAAFFEKRQGNFKGR